MLKSAKLNAVELTCAHRGWASVIQSVAAYSLFILACLSHLISSPSPNGPLIFQLIPDCFTDFTSALFPLPFFKIGVPDLTNSPWNELISYETGQTTSIQAEVCFLGKLRCLKTLYVM